MIQGGTILNRIYYLLLITLLLVGCTAEESQNNDKRSESTLKVAYQVQPPSFDPHFTNATATRDTSRNVFETLLSFDEKYEVKPVLAESYEESKDGKIITFHLRKGVKFHNGNEMVADDVVASMNRWKSINTQGIAYFSNSEFRKEDDYTITLNMNKPLTIAKYILANPNHFAGIMPKEVIQAVTDKGVTEFIGTGPFKYNKWVQDQYIHLVKNEEYQTLSSPEGGMVGKREPLVDNLYFYFVPDSSTRLNGIQTGEYDVALAIPTDSISKVENDPNLEQHIYSGGYMTIILNKRQGLFTNEKARKAINMAVNKRDALAAAFSNEKYFTLEHGLLAKSYSNWYNDAGKEVYDQYDPEEARQLLKEAGYQGEPVRMLTTRDYEDQYQVAIVVQQQLEEIGVNVDLQVYDWPTLSQLKEDDNSHDLHIMGYSPVSDPTKLYFLDSRLNTAGWPNNPKLDGLLDELIIAKTQQEAKAIFTEIQEESWDYLPIIKLGDYSRITVARKDVKGFNYFEGPTVWDVSNSNK